MTAPPSLATSLGLIAWPVTISPVHFVKLELTGSDGSLISENFYWHAGVPAKGTQQSFRDLEGLPKVGLDVSATVNGAPGTAILPNGIPSNASNLENRAGALEINGPAARCVLTVTIRNPSNRVALMTHLQLRRAHSGTRVLPAFYSDNYFSLIPGETRRVVIDAAQSDFQGEPPLIAVDGWNVTVTNTQGATVPTGPALADSTDPPGSETAGVGPGSTVAIALNRNAQVDQWPWTGLPMAR